MRAGGGKQKGAQFERDVCVMLSKWVSSGKREDVFWRSAMSGGRATVGRKQGKQHSAQVGDISCIHPVGQHFIEHFAPECKYYADLGLTGLLTGRGKLLTFWDTINREASAHGKQAFLVAKQNRQPTLVCLSADACIALGILSRHATLIYPPQGMRMFEFETFLTVCKPYVVTDRGSPSNRPRKRRLPIRNL